VPVGALAEVLAAGPEVRAVADDAVAVADDAAEPSAEATGEEARPTVEEAADPVAVCVDVRGGSAAVAAWAGRENTSMTATIPAATSAACIAPRAMRRTNGCMSSSHWRRKDRKPGRSSTRRRRRQTSRTWTSRSVTTVQLLRQSDKGGANRPVWQDGRMPLELRTGTPADVDELLGLWAEAAENAERAPDTREAVTALLGRDPEALIVAEDAGRLVGSVIAGWDGWRCHLYRLAVHPDWRRRGVGSALLRAAEDRFTTVGGARADAMVLTGNGLGQSLWQAGGYRSQDEWRRWVKMLG
jgi:ribosomal protein S18 acetylase RimI-like enzyme